MTLRRLSIGTALAALLLAGCADGQTPADDAIQTEDAPAGPTETEDTDDTTEDEDPGTEQQLTATFLDPDGQELGTVELRETEDGTEVSVRVSDLEPGFRGLHVHGIGVCEPDSTDPEDPGSTGDFMSAGPHLNPDDTDHADHVGDLSPLLVTDDGQAVLTQVTDRFTIADLQDDDGAAFMVHGDPDNFAHIPERYGEPDEDTLGTGDAGDRVACAVIE